MRQSAKLGCLDSSGRKANTGNGQEIHQTTLSHTLPTSQDLDPELSFILEVWDRLADECKHQLIETVKMNLPATKE